MTIRREGVEVMGVRATFETDDGLTTTWIKTSKGRTATRIFSIVAGRLKL